MAVEAVVEVEPDAHAGASRAAASLRMRRGCVADHVSHFREVLQSSAATHVLLPGGAKLTKQQETRANRVEAQALGIQPDEIHRNFFDREGSSSGVIDSKSAVEMLGSAFDVINESQRQWGSEIEFISATDSSVRGLRAVAMSYIASDGAQQRKRKARSEGKGGSERLAGDGPGQPRLRRVYNARRGVHIDQEALEMLQQDSEYMRDVRTTQMMSTADCILTLRHFGYGGAGLAARGKSPIAKASSTVMRFCGQHDSFQDACTSLGGSTIASCNCGPLNLHADGVKKRSGEPTVELCTTRWAHLLSGLQNAQKRARLADARRSQPLLSKTLWLGHSLALDIEPAGALAIVTGTEEDHGVPVPEPAACGEGDLERGLTRSFAQSMRPDEATTDDPASFEDDYERRPGLRPGAQRGGREMNSAGDGDVATRPPQRQAHGPRQAATTGVRPGQAAAGGMGQPAGRRKVAPHRPVRRVQPAGSGSISAGKKKGKKNRVSKSGNTY